MTIVQHPDPILLTPAERVTDFSSVPMLAQKMFDAMREFRGIGLAANQIGNCMRVAVMQVPGWPETVMVNPQIVRTKGEGTASEGCLSVQSSRLRLPVRRAKIVWVEYQDESGNTRKLKATDLLARCIQHEIDHLNGMTCLERV